MITNAGYKLDDFSIIYINKDYVFEEELDLNQLFITQSVLSEVIERQEAIKAQIQLAKQATQLTKSPDIPVGEHYNIPYPCDFQGHCWKGMEKEKQASNKIVKPDDHAI